MASQTAPTAAVVPDLENQARDPNRNPPRRLRLLSDRQMAERYEVSRQSIWRWARDGVIPAPKKISPGMTRWLADELDAHDRARGLI